MFEFLHIPIPGCTVDKRDAFATILIRNAYEMHYNQLREIYINEDGGDSN